MNENLKPIKRKKYGGRPVKITEEIVDRVADRVSRGVPLRYALACDPEPISLDHWKTTLEKRVVLAARFDKKIGEWVSAALDKINSSTCRTLPGECWTLERRLPEFFSTRSAPSTQVNIQSVVLGIPDSVMRRAREIVNRSAEPKLLADKK